MAVVTREKIPQTRHAVCDVVPFGLLVDRESGPLVFLWTEETEELPDRIILDESERFLAFTSEKTFRDWVQEHGDQYRVYKTAPDPMVVIDWVDAMNDLAHIPENTDNLASFICVLDDFHNSFKKCDAAQEQERDTLMRLFSHMFDHHGSTRGFYRGGRGKRQVYEMAQNLTNRILLNTRILA
ncbi:MAG: hypothetical protein GC168_20995 [Candidatus Hydrogenedens sp.]|nr:hypothetical protein [Candidatus Hydrogenedens sp.]